MNYLKICVVLLIVSLNIKLFASNPEIFESKADSLIRLMTIEEKIGQLDLDFINFPGGFPDSGLFKKAKEGKIGGVFHLWGCDMVESLQKEAVEKSRLGIPLLFGLDVVNGHKTMFPTGIAQASTWDMDLIEKIDRISATEASAEGVNWVFAPMVDITRDARWGRVCESPGEDTWLACKIAEAKIKGFQADDLSRNNTVMTCVKHFAAYGAPLSGKDYNSVDMSDISLFEWYLPPYKASVNAGAGSFMASFNSLNGIPSTSNKWLLTDLLRNNWKFDGIVVSDYEAVLELVPFGITSNVQEGVVKAISAGTDIDMNSQSYLKYLKELITSGKVQEESLNIAVKRVLIAKYRLGLFDDPYRYCDKKREKNEVLKPEFLQFAREAASKSCILLKNDKHILPIKNIYNTIAIIGPLADAKRELLGSNVNAGDPKMTVSILEGIKNKLPAKTKLIYEKGCNIDDLEKSNIEKAISAANQSDFIIIVVGENELMSGESKSRSDIHLPGVQQELADKILKLGKPCAVVVVSGRPLILTGIDSIAPAILEAWQGGIQAGNGVADVLFGDYNPSAKTTVTFPRNMGQIPIYYNTTSIGRSIFDEKKSGKFQDWRSRYIDSPNAPLYPFGYGLSYTNFSYSEITLSDSVYKETDKIKASVIVSNIGDYDGEEIVQLYIHDKVADLTRPVKELRGFEKIKLKKGESQRVEFTLNLSDLAYYHPDLSFSWDPGEFEVLIGPNSADTKAAKFLLK